MSSLEILGVYVIGFVVSVVYFVVRWLRDEGRRLPERRDVKFTLVASALWPIVVIWLFAED